MLTFILRRNVIWNLVCFFPLLFITTSGVLQAAQRWVMNEYVFTSNVEYSDHDAFYKVRVDVDFVSEKGTILTVPAFWDGGKTWRVRFAPTEIGQWHYTTRCNYTENNGLHQKKGNFQCTEYTGNLKIYKHGFVTTGKDLKYMIYADGTPFFYLGDTHWGMLTEEIDSAGPHAGKIDTKSHFCYVVDRRVEQRFTVYQSEPIGTSVNYKDGISSADLPGFQKMDRYFQYIAQKGLVHANSQFFFPNSMKEIEKDEEFLELISRYWVARYSAWPVLWTLGQEVDDNFYDVFSIQENPYVKVCQWIYYYDAYKHPITGHQENTGMTTRTGVAKSKPSRFQNVPGHTWYGVQWSPDLKNKPSVIVPQDYWNNGTGKPALLYESRYCYLWTKDFGARLQGWMAFLNGMYGYGYGAIDMWLYKSSYDINNTSSDGIDTMTPKDKAIHWSQAIEFPSAHQVGYMKKFLETFDWWKLTPEFAGPAFFQPGSEKVFYFAAQVEHKIYVLYFFSQNKETGKIVGLNSGQHYRVEWMNPRTGEMKTINDNMVPKSDGTFNIPERMDDQDWVLRIQQR